MLNKTQTVKSQKTISSYKFSHLRKKREKRAAVISKDHITSTVGWL